MLHLTYVAPAHLGCEMDAHNVVNVYKSSLNVA